MVHVLVVSTGGAAPVCSGIHASHLSVAVMKHHSQSSSDEKEFISAMVPGDRVHSSRESREARGRPGSPGIASQLFSPTQEARRGN